MHTHGKAGVVWYGGMGHKLISGDGGSECYRCGMFVEDAAVEELIPDCSGPDLTGHHWQAAPRGGNECAYGDARVASAKVDPGAPVACRRA